MHVQCKIYNEELFAFLIINRTYQEIGLSFVGKPIFVGDAGCGRSSADDDAYNKSKIPFGRLENIAYLCSADNLMHYC